jgi:hypothetical protein
MPYHTKSHVNFVDFSEVNQIFFVCVGWAVFGERVWTGFIWLKIGTSG